MVPKIRKHTPSHKAVGPSLPLSGVWGGARRCLGAARAPGRPSSALGDWWASLHKHTHNTKPLAFCRVGLLRLVLSWARHVCLCGAAALGSLIGSLTCATYLYRRTIHLTPRHREAGRAAPADPALPRTLLKSFPGPLLTHAPPTLHTTHSLLP